MWFTDCIRIDARAPRSVQVVTLSLSPVGTIREVCLLHFTACTLLILSIFSRPFELEGDVSNVMLLSPNPESLQKMYFKSIICQITLAAKFVRGLNRL